MSQTLAILSTFTALATVAIGLRLITRFRLVRTAGWDDGLVVLAWVLPSTICTILDKTDKVLDGGYYLLCLCCPGYPFPPPISKSR